MKKHYVHINIEVHFYHDDVITMSTGGEYNVADDNVGADPF